MDQSKPQSVPEEEKENKASAAQIERYKMMTGMPVPRLIRKLALPTIFSMLVTSFYNMADTFFVGRISTQATAAVGLVFSLMALIQAIGFFCGHGSGNYMSRQLGSGNYEEANRMAATGFSLAFLLGLLVLLLGQLFLDPLALFLGATPTTLADTRAYMRIILVGAPFMTSQLVINNQLRFQGSAVYAMTGLVAGAIFNILLDPLFIFVFGLGVAGAALATVISQIVSFLVLYRGSLQGVNVHIRLSNTTFNRHFFFEILNGGLASLFRQGMASIAAILLNSAAGRLGGDAAIAGMSVVTRVMMFANSALIGFGQGMQPVSAFNYGAKKYGRVREAYFFCVRYGTAFLLFMSVLCFSFAPQIIRFFRNDPEVIAVGRVALRCQASVFWMNATIVMSNMMIQSIGKGFRATLLAGARNGFFFIPLILLLPGLFGLTGVEITQTCADICTFLLAIPLAYGVLKDMKRKESAQ